MIALLLLLLILGAALWLIDGRLTQGDGELLGYAALLWVVARAERRSWR